MTVDVSPLFRPLVVKGMQLRNRIVMPPMVVLRGLTTREGVDWYGQHARGGPGLVIVEATSVDRFGTDLTAQNLRPLVRAIRDGGALSAIQLLPTRRLSRVSPVQLTISQIQEIVDRYRLAAEICAEAGFDGFEPHGAHGYLLNQFFSPERNQRTNAYGGDLVGRMRLALEIVGAVRPVLGPDRLLLYRHTPAGYGYGIDDSLVLAKALVDAGVDILDISPSSVDYPGDRAAPFRSLGAPVIAVGHLDVVESALEVLNEGRADLIAVGRGMIADPEWTAKVKEGRSADIVKCIRCDVKCHGNLKAGNQIGCARWT